MKLPKPKNDISEQLDTWAKKTGIPRKTITSAIYQDSIADKKCAEADLWKNAGTHGQLVRWINKSVINGQALGLLEFSEEVPFIARKALVKLVKSMPRRRGGRPSALNLFEQATIRQQVQSKVDKGSSKEKAYQEIANKAHVSAHTIRRICEPNERARSRQSKQIALLPLRP